MKILLIAPSFAKTKNSQYFPIGLSCLASYVKQFGHEVIPLNLNNHEENKREPLIKDAIINGKPDIIGTGCLSASFLEIKRILRFIRGLVPDIPIILGGGIFSSEPELMMHELSPDFGIAGEGEIVLANLLDFLEHGHGVISTIKGLWFRNKKQITYTGPGPLIQDLNNLPPPDIELFGMREFLKIKAEELYLPHLIRLDTGDNKIIPISASRSCPHNCTFCYHADLGRYKQLSVKNLVKLIKIYIEKFRTNKFVIYDELFSANGKRIINFCHLLREEKIEIRWSCQLRVDSINQELLYLLKASGCSFIGYGFESGCDAILHNMNKKISAAQIERAVVMTRKAKIGFQANFLFGDPAETENTIQESLNFQDQNELNFVDWSMVIPYPGSKIYKDCVTSGSITNKINFIHSICKLSVYLWRDKINFTSMANKNFNHWYHFLRERNDINHPRKQCAQINNSEIVAKFASKITISCPRCDSTIQHKLFYPPECRHGIPNPNSISNLTGVNILCPSCYRKMHITAPNIPHMKSYYKKFQDKIRVISRAAKPVAIMPAMDRLFSIFSEDIDLSPLNISKVFDTRPNRIRDTFMDKMVQALNKENCRTAIDHVFIILPWVESDKSLSMLLSTGINKNNVVSWNEMFTTAH